VSTLHTVVRNARAPERLVPLLEDLGERHHGYGVQPGNFEVMGQALLATLAELEGPRWGPEPELLWTRAYQHIAEHMTRGLAKARRGATPRTSANAGHFDRSP
jgi:hemoglobin-like flavoprotein